MSRKLKKIGMIQYWLVATMLISGSLLGIGYAYWTDELVGETIMTTGRVDSYITMKNGCFEIGQVGNENKGQKIKIKCEVSNTGSVPIKYIGYSKDAVLRVQKEGREEQVFIQLPEDLMIEYSHITLLPGDATQMQWDMDKILNEEIRTQMIYLLGREGHLVSGDYANLEIILYFGTLHQMYQSFDVSSTPQGWHRQVVLDLMMKHGNARPQNEPQAITTSAMLSIGEGGLINEME